MARPKLPRKQAKKLMIGTWQFPLIGGRAQVKQFEVQQVRDGLVLRQRLEGAVAEMFQGSLQKPKNQLRIRIPSVFGRQKVLTIGEDWIQLGDRIFRAQATSPKKGKGP